MQVKWLTRALENLDEEAAYLSKESPKAAKDFVLCIQESVARLRDHPNMGRPGRVPGTRELVLTGFPYILPYRVREGYIEILRVFHGSRKWPSELP